jgi:hypothetical protein
LQPIFWNIAGADRTLPLSQNSVTLAPTTAALLLLTLCACGDDGPKTFFSKLTCTAPCACDTSFMCDPTTRGEDVSSDGTNACQCDPECGCTSPPSCQMCSDELLRVDSQCLTTRNRCEEAILNSNDPVTVTTVNEWADCYSTWGICERQATDAASPCYLNCGDVSKSVEIRCIGNCEFAVGGCASLAIRDFGRCLSGCNFTRACLDQCTPARDAAANECGAQEMACVDEC